MTHATENRFARGTSSEKPKEASSSRQQNNKNYQERKTFLFVMGLSETWKAWPPESRWNLTTSKNKDSTSHWLTCAGWDSQRESRLELGLVANDFTVTTGVLRNDSKLSMDGYTRKTLNVCPGLRIQGLVFWKNPRTTVWGKEWSEA